MPQFFKGDEIELKYYNSANPTQSAYSLQKDEFFDDAYACQVLGDLLYDEQRAPLANAIPRDIFRQSFTEIFEAFVAGGTLESYLTVFRKIFGESVEIEFTIPGPGKLNIVISAAGIEISNFIARYIFNDDYIYDNVITQDGDQIVFQTVQGFQTQYDLEQLLIEMVAGGIVTQITFDIGA